MLHTYQQERNATTSESVRTQTYHLIPEMTRTDVDVLLRISQPRDILQTFLVQDAL